MSHVEDGGITPDDQHSSYGVIRIFFFEWQCYELCHHHHISPNMSYLTNPIPLLKIDSARLEPGVTSMYKSWKWYHSSSRRLGEVRIRPNLG